MLRPSTIENYQAIWRQFNSFLVRLDRILKSWTERTTVFCAFLIQKGTQSVTLRSYISGIKAMVKYVNYEWSDNKMILSSLTKVCRLHNGRLKCRLSIQKGLFEQILFELDPLLENQTYINCLYRAAFCLAYYGLM